MIGINKGLLLGGEILLMNVGDFDGLLMVINQRLFLLFIVGEKRLWEIELLEVFFSELWQKGGFSGHHEIDEHVVKGTWVQVIL